MINTARELVAAVELQRDGTVRVEHWDDRVEMLSQEEYARRNIGVGGPDPGRKLREQVAEAISQIKEARDHTNVAYKKAEGTRAAALYAKYGAYDWVLGIKNGPADAFVGKEYYGKVGKKAAGRLLDGHEHNDLPGVVAR